MNYVLRHSRIFNVISITPILFILVLNYFTYKELTSKLGVADEYMNSEFYNVIYVINLVVGISTTLILWVLFSFAIYIGLKSFSNAVFKFSQVLRLVAISFIPFLITTLGIYIITRYTSLHIDYSNVQEFQKALDESNYKEITTNTRLVGYAASSILCFFLLKWKYKLSIPASLIIVYVPLLFLAATFFIAQTFIY